MIEIDGSHGEGGGQIIRTSLTLAAITQKPVRIMNIRANRPKPGLAAQHLTACKAVRNICRGTLTGAEVGSTTLTFEPGPIVGGKYEFDIGTAGSVTLVAQTIIPILINASKESEIRIIGGTHVMKSPGYDYFEKVFVPVIRKLGVKIETKMIKTGYYPKGGGIIDIEIKPCELHGCNDWQHTEDIQAIIRIAGLQTSIAIREKKIFVQNDITKIYIREDDALSIGNAITTWNGFRGVYVLGEKGKRAEIVAKEAIDILRKEEGDVDLHLADQLLVYAALAKGETTYRTSEITEHFRTNAEIIGRFIQRYITYEKGNISIV